MQTWEDIKKQYPNEHVVIANPQCPIEYPAKIEAGDVVDHDPELENLLSRCDRSRYDSCAIMYTGDLGELIGERGMVRIIEHD
jgi:hypothetical protein